MSLVKSFRPKPWCFLPSCACYDKDNDQWIIISWFQSEISVYDKDYELMQTFGTEGTDRLQFNHPFAACIGKNDYRDFVFVCDTNNYRIQIVSTKGVYIDEFYCSYPHGICVDEKNNLYISSWSHRFRQNEDFKIYVIAWGTTAPYRTFGVKGDQPGHLEAPEHLCFSDEHNQLFVCDSGNDRIQVFTPEGQFVRAFGSRGDGNLQFHHPRGICIDKNGTLLVSDYCNRRIVAYKWDGKQETFLGTLTHQSRDTLEFFRPWGICADSKKHLVVADSMDCKIKAFDCRNVRLSFMSCLYFAN